ncbi:hypothetical protein MKZ38_002613 [Zalerion maritima]|uniref:Uncharacterized protein n=1 Tax=Zalerion maritima TaxID=339359 RepID=A0AAD5RWX9_9PEZI|nr:hypothetical protein MKZ38_002613 [Zalerion maritima]
MAALTAEPQPASDITSRPHPPPLLSERTVVDSTHLCPARRCNRGLAATTPKFEPTTETYTNPQTKRTTRRQRNIQDGGTSSS